jgi:hypothetical protein
VVLAEEDPLISEVLIALPNFQIATKLLRHQRWVRPMILTGPLRKKLEYPRPDHDERSAFMAGIA